MGGAQNVAKNSLLLFGVDRRSLNVIIEMNLKDIQEEHNINGRSFKFTGVAEKNLLKNVLPKWEEQNSSVFKPKKILQ